LYKYFFLLLLFISCQKQEERNISTPIKDWEFKYENNWHKAIVPGNNFSDLLNNNFIVDPFYGTNEDSLQWVSEKVWKYHSKFKVSKETLAKSNHTLIFKGLDTYAKVFLNDSLILKANNMFRSWKIDVSENLKQENKLLIIFEPTSKIEKTKQQKLGYHLPGGSRVFTRKAGFHYGWDWGAKISPTGIWREVELQSWNDCKITDLYIKQNHLTDTIANLSVEIEIASSIEKSINIKAYNKVWKNINLKKGNNKFSFSIHIPNPELWWPNGYGEQKLYDIPISIFDENGIIDKQKKKIGLRKIELISEQDSIGESFYFKVNNKPIFMKGANYIPQDNLQNRVTKSHYQNLLNDVIKANMNMLRVWGGGLYEEDLFYNLCDSLGILIWQDFMFACAMYPSDSLFIENITAEATENVKRLRNHPSIALWCGNNENSEGWHRWGWQDAFTENQKTEIWKGYQKVFQETLPKIVNSYSQSAYWESSPKFGRGNPQHQFEGDAHYWGVWHDAEPFENFERKVPRFMSEFGFQSFPQLSTIAKFADSSQWHLNSDVMKNHQKHPRGNSLILEYMQRQYPVPSDFDKFIYTSQILQAEGMRIGLEAHRRNQPYCMGTLYWQLNDCWPVASWSSRDYYGNWKALHYTVQDIFSPISLSLHKDKEGFINLWAISDFDSTFTDTLIIEVYNIKEDVLWKTHTKQINIKPGSQLLKRKIEHLGQGQFIIGKLKNSNITSKTLFTSPIKDILFKEPNITASWNENKLILTTKNSAFQVYLHGIDVHFSDNFFTLQKGERKIIEVSGYNFEKDNLVIWSLHNLNK
jgi:beta-mannosidase